MKRGVIMTLVVIVCTAIAISQTTGLPDFFGFKWGTTQTVVKAGMMKRKGCKLNSSASEPDLLFYEGGEFSGQWMESLLLLFYHDSLCSGTVFLQAGPGKCINLFRTMKERLSEKYGKPSHDFYYFNSPYEEGDGHEETAFRIGKGTAAVYWDIPDDPHDAILLRINDQLNVTVRYEDGDLMGKYQAEKKAKEQDDL